MLLRQLLDLRLLAPAAIAAASIAAAGLTGVSDAVRPQAADALAAGIGVDKCIEVETGATFEVSILVSDVTDFLAWDVLYLYNRQVVEVTGKDVRRILEASPNSNVFDLSDPVPNSIGNYRLGAADTGGTGAAESGSGILATLTMRAKTKGLSWSAIYRGDVDGNGTIDVGPTLTALGGVHIGDTNGDSVFDGPISSGQIAVDLKCENPVPTAPVPNGLVVVDPAGTPTIQPTSNDVSPSETPTPPTQTSGEPTGTPTPTRVEFVDTTAGGGGSGPALSSWLIGILASSAVIGVVLFYVIHKSARRPA